jgi:hypothetical protein
LSIFYDLLSEIRHEPSVVITLHLTVNGKITVEGPRGIPYEKGLYPLVDLFGNVAAITLQRNCTDANIGFGDDDDGEKRKQLVDARLQKSIDVARTHLSEKRLYDADDGGLASGFVTVCPKLEVHGVENQTLVYRGLHENDKKHPHNPHEHAFAMGNGRLRWEPLLKGYFFEVRLDRLEELAPDEDMKARNVNKKTEFSDGLTIGVTELLHNVRYIKIKSALTD